MKLEYGIGKIKLGAKGNGTWTHITSRRTDFATINAGDFNYGLTFKGRFAPRHLLLDRLYRVLPSWLYRRCHEHRRPGVERPLSQAFFGQSHLCDARWFRHARPAEQHSPFAQRTGTHRNHLPRYSPLRHAPCGVPTECESEEKVNGSKKGDRKLSSGRLFACCIISVCSLG